jgi:hypothetical protein
MSRRRLEQGATGASSFSLRAITTTPDVAAVVQRSAVPGVAPPLPTGSTPSLNFRFATLNVKPVEAAFKPFNQFKTANLNNNFFAKPVGSSGESGDVLRLSATVDDLTQRLRKTTELKNRLEGQVQRINAVLVQERQNATSRMQSLKADMASVQESEGRMRSELAVRPVAKEVDASRFQSSVRTALEQEETNARVAEAEVRVATLTKRAETLATEVNLLEERKSNVLSSDSVSAKEVEVLAARAVEAQAKLANIEDMQAVARDSIAHLEATRDARREESKAAQEELAIANAATATAIADTAAAKVRVKELREEGEVAQKELAVANAATATAIADTAVAKAQVQELRAEHGSVSGQVDALKTKLAELEVAVEASSTKTSGAHAPKGLLGRIQASPVQMIDALSCCGDNIGFHFAHDCPIGLGCIHVPASLDASVSTGLSDAMVDAIVRDIKSYWKNASNTHAALHSAPTAAASTAATSVAAH